MSMILIMIMRLVSIINLCIYWSIQKGLRLVLGAHFFPTWVVLLPMIIFTPRTYGSIILFVYSSKSIAPYWRVKNIHCTMVYSIKADSVWLVASHRNTCYIVSINIWIYWTPFVILTICFDFKLNAPSIFLCSCWRSVSHARNWGGSICARIFRITPYTHQRWISLLSPWVVNVRVEGLNLNFWIFFGQV